MSITNDTENILHSAVSSKDLTKLSSDEKAELIKNARVVFKWLPVYYGMNDLVHGKIF